MVVAALAIGAAGLSAGCYRRVVGASGFGNAGTSIQNPYRTTTEADRFLFDEQPEPRFERLEKPMPRKPFE